MRRGNPFVKVITSYKEARRTRERISMLRDLLIHDSEAFFTTPTTLPNHPLNETQEIRWACDEDITLAFEQGDLEMLELYEAHFSTTTGVRLVSICVDTTRMRGETPTNNLVERYLDTAEKINKVRQRHGGHYHEGIPEERGGAAKLLSFLVDHPEHEDVILRFVELRGIPDQDDVEPLMQQLAATPVLADGAL